ncbi:MAG TPA: hypothetical protein VFI22_09740 [Thermomicrobiales bacterium]|nr:hypothetical protein [Thermomicrobiales bacterium]
MDARRFDALCHALAAPRSRRSTMRSLGAGAFAALAGAPAARVRAQAATPATGTPTAGGVTEFLYIQTFTAGTLRPKAGASGVFELALAGGAGHTTYFADRPQREVGIAPTERALAAVGVGGATPPNAGLVAQTDDGERVVIVELLASRLDEATEILTYDVRPLPGYAGSGLARLAAKQSDEPLPATFGAASLFIDGGGCPYRICGGICCDHDHGMVCQGKGAYCVSVYQSGVCQGGNACNQHPHTACNPEGNCYCGTDIEGGGACVVGDAHMCQRSSCGKSSDCAYGKLCVGTGKCCADTAHVCMPLCQD